MCIVPAVVEGAPCYEAYHPDLPGCRAMGRTHDEARRNLADARGLYLQALAERGVQAPPPCPDALAATWKVHLEG